MRILAIETIGLYGSLALLEAGEDSVALDEATSHLAAGAAVPVLAELSLAGPQRTARTLAPGIRELLARQGWNPRDVQLTAVAVGPGSFTGLRLGVTTAKTFAYATGGAIVGVDSLHALAWGAAELLAENITTPRQLETIIDAQRRQLFCRRFACDAGERLSPTSATQVVDEDAWLAGLNADTLLAGPALARLRDRLPAAARLTPESVWNPSAAAVGRLGYSLFRSGQRDDVFRLLPQYHRISAAEETWDRRQPPEVSSPRK